MKLSELINELAFVLETYGDIETTLDEAEPEVIRSYEKIWVVPEENENGAWVCSVRSWMY